jgi:hypothetical protein
MLINPFVLPCLSNNEKIFYSRMHLRVYQQYVCATSKPSFPAARGMIAVMKAIPIAHIKYLYDGKDVLSD